MVGRFLIIKILKYNAVSWQFSHCEDEGASFKWFFITNAPSVGRSGFPDCANPPGSSDSSREALSVMSPGNEIRGQMKYEPISLSGLSYQER
jgi:hypothetical protein